MNIFPFSHDTLMTLNIVLAGVHILLSLIILVLIQTSVKLPSFVLPLFLIVSIIACTLILLYSLECKNKY